MRVLAAIAASAVLAGGCMPKEEEVPTRDDVRYACDASKAQGMVGQVATQALGTEAVRATGSRTMRWITPGGAYTMDYRTDRLNIHLDSQNRVTRIVCG